MFGLTCYLPQNNQFSSLARIVRQYAGRGDSPQRLPAVLRRRWRVAPELGYWVTSKSESSLLLPRQTDPLTTRRRCPKQRLLKQKKASEPSLLPQVSSNPARELTLSIHRPRSPLPHFQHPTCVN